jgi:Zn finger protein HypA/HybF involved in hydrogenase expression
MPRKTKITAIPVEAPEEGLARAWTEEAQTDAQHMTDIINEIKVADTEVKPEVEQPAEEQRVEVKPKRTRSTKAKTVEPQIEVTPAIEEVQVEVELPQEDVKAEPAKVTCPDCGKQMSAKTLKYSHVPNCTARKAAAGAAETQSPREEARKSLRDQATDDMLHYEIDQRLLMNRRAERATRRQAMVDKLIANAF